jgi:hypothetical protein
VASLAGGYAWKRAVELVRFIADSIVEMEPKSTRTPPFDARVAELKAGAGAQVAEGALLIRIEPDA